MKKYFSTIVLGLVLTSGALAQQDFTPGNLVVYRIGNGTDAYDVTKKVTAPIFLDEYNVTATAATLVQSIALPTATSGNNRRIVSAGQALTEGYISRSADGRYIVVPGYDADLKINVGDVDASRVVALVDYQGAINSSTHSTLPGGAFRSATSDNGEGIWVSGSGGDEGGISYIPTGSTTPVFFGTSNNTTRQVKFYNGQLYATGINYIHKVGVGAPKTASEAQPFTNVSPDPASSDCYNFFIVDVSTDKSVRKEVAYIVDAAYGIVKYSIVDGVWTENGDYGVGDDSKSFRGLEGIIESDGHVRLYIVKCTGTDSSLITLKDDGGYQESLATTGMTELVNFTGTNKAARGIAWVPVKEGLSSTQKISADNAVQVYVQSGSICVELALTVTLNVYNSQGMRIRTVKANEGLNILSGLPKDQLYLIQAGDKAVKVKL